MVLWDCVLSLGYVSACCLFRKGKNSKRLVVASSTTIQVYNLVQVLLNVFLLLSAFNILQANYAVVDWCSWKSLSPYHVPNLWLLNMPKQHQDWLLYAYYYSRYLDWI